MEEKTNKSKCMCLYRVGVDKAAHKHGHTRFNPLSEKIDSRFVHDSCRVFEPNDPFVAAMIL